MLAYTVGGQNSPQNSGFGSCNDFRIIKKEKKEKKKKDKTQAYNFLIFSIYI